MGRAHVKNVLLIAVAIGVAYLCFRMAAPFLIAIAWAAVLAIVVDPLHERLSTRVKSRGVSAGITCALTVLVILLPLVGISIVVTRSVLNFLGDGPGGSGGISQWIAYEFEIVSRWLYERFGIEPLGREDITENARGIVEYLIGQSRSLVGGVAGFFFNLVVVIFSLFFFLRDKRLVLNSIREFLPLSAANTTAVFKRVRDVIWAAVIGGGAVSITQGVLATLAFAVLGVPNAPLLGIATSFFSLIPFIGAAGVWIPTAIILLIKGSIWKAVVLALWGTFVISLVDNILRPILIGDATRLHTLLIFFSILGGLQVFGFLGIIVGPVVLAVGLALVEIFKREISETEREGDVAVGENEPADRVPVER